MATNCAYQTLSAPSDGSWRTSTAERNDVSTLTHPHRVGCNNDDDRGGFAGTMSVTSYSSALGLYGLSPRAESASSYVLPASSYTYSTPQDPQPSVWRHNNSIIHNDSDYYPSAPPSPAPVPIPFRNVDRHPPAFLPASQNFYSRASHHVSPSLSPPYTPYHSPPPSGSSRPTALPIESLVQHSFIYRSPEDSHPPSRAISRSESASGAPNEDVKPALSATALEARPTGLYIEATRRAEETRDVFKLSLAPAEAKVERSRVKKASLAGDLDSPRRRHFCPLCDCRGFARPSALKIHILSHTKEKPHVCDVCTRPFAVQSNLRRHRKLHGASSRVPSEFEDTT